MPNELLVRVARTDYADASLRGCSEHVLMLPPGRARLATNPLPMGSPTCVITMGIVEVASLAARLLAHQL